MRSEKNRCGLVAPALLAILAIGSGQVAIAEDNLPPAPQEYLGRTIARTMHYAGAPWLVRESREREEEPAKLIESLGIRPGQTACDLGCGNGFYTLKLSAAVGPQGKVWAVDIQPEMIDLLEQRLKARKRTNVEAVVSTAIDPKLPEGELDLLLLVDVYHEFSHPEPMLAAIRKSLAPTGRVALVEFRSEDPTVPIKRLHKMSQQQCQKEFTANDMKLVGQYDELPWQHVLFYARDDSPLEEQPLRLWDKSDAAVTRPGLE